MRSLGTGDYIKLSRLFKTPKFVLPRLQARIGSFVRALVLSSFQSRVWYSVSYRLLAISKAR